MQLDFEAEPDAHTLCVRRRCVPEGKRRGQGKERSMAGGMEDAEALTQGWDCGGYGVHARTHSRGRRTWLGLGQAHSPRVA